MRKMQLIGQITSLEQLEVSGVPQNTETLSKISHLPLLKTLIVRKSALRSGDLAGIVGLRNLESLFLSGNDLLDDDLVEPLSRLPKLKELDVLSDHISEAGLRALGNNYLLRWEDETIIPGLFYGEMEIPTKEKKDKDTRNR
jgi:Leucine-rich repeat (LRR) protein